MQQKRGRLCQHTASASGLTLLEVLVALAILAIALTAVLKTASENIQQQIYLHDKTVATLAGMLVMNEIRTGVLRLDGLQEDLQGESIQLNQAWTWHAALKQTPNPDIQQIEVRVAREGAGPGERHDVLARLTGFIHVPQK